MNIPLQSAGVEMCVVECPAKGVIRRATRRRERPCWLAGTDPPPQLRKATATGRTD